MINWPAVLAMFAPVGRRTRL